MTHDIVATVQPLCVRKDQSKLLEEERKGGREGGGKEGGRERRVGRKGGKGGREGWEEREGGREEGREGGREGRVRGGEGGRKSGRGSKLEYFTGPEYHHTATKSKNTCPCSLTQPTAKAAIVP